MRGRRLLIALAVVAIALYVAASSIFVVNEGEQALVVRLGAPVATIDAPGLKFKAPFIDAVYMTSTRSLLLEPPVEQAIMGDQKRLEVQPYIRYRIVAPLRFYQAVRTQEAANAQLDQFVSSSARRALGQSPLTALLTEQRAQILDAIKREVATKAEPLGNRGRRGPIPPRRSAVRNQPGDLRPDEIRAPARGEGIARRRASSGPSRFRRAPTASAPSSSPRRRRPGPRRAAKATRRRTGRSPTPSRRTRPSIRSSLAADL